MHFHAPNILLATALMLLCRISSADVFISELHYDNDGTDTGEAIELVGAAGTVIDGWTLVLYNGSSSQLRVYDSIALSGSLQASEGCGDFGFYVIEFPSNGIQNGAPDGLALVDASGAVVEFLSYEGEFIPTDGPAAGLSSTDIGVQETASTPVGYSLQRDLLSGEWSSPAEAHFGTCAGGSEPEPEPPTALKISQLQGEGDEVTTSEPVVIEAIVVGDFQADQQLNGFFVQEEDSDQDGNPATSEGIFVYCGSCVDSVQLGDLVRVSGEPGEYQGMSQIYTTAAGSVEVLASDMGMPTPARLRLPVPALSNVLAEAEAQVNAYFEQVEGMLVTIEGESVVSEYFQLGRYGEIVLANGERFRQFTDVALPSEQGFEAHQIEQLSRRIVLDDGSTEQNPDFTPFPLPYLSQSNFVRGGDRLSDLTGPLNFAFGKWRVQAVHDWFDYEFTPVNPRPFAPGLRLGNLSLASFNVLNYFASLDLGDDNCGPSNAQECRGADSEAELERQQAKLVAAICDLDADILGLMELENPAAEDQLTPVEVLVNAVNASCGGYQAIVTGPIGDDAITVGMMFRDAVVKPVGDTAVLDSVDFLDPLNTGENKNRPALAQSFEHIASGKTITVVVNHFKSKGSSCGAGDDDTLTGQGNCNGTRTAAAATLVDWLAGQPTGEATERQLVLGDLNAYRFEDPIQVFLQAGFTDLIDSFIGESAYSFVFDGQTGYLDHALASDALLPEVIAVEEWHINADEVNLFDYNSEFKPINYLDELFASNAYRSSDHDPVLVQLFLQGPPRCDGALATVYIDEQGTIVGGLLDGLPYGGLLLGSQGADVIVGSDGDDLLQGLGGDDRICAGAGNDIALGGRGRDALFGEAGDDILMGGRDADRLDGGDGRDLLVGGKGRDNFLNGELVIDY